MNDRVRLNTDQRVQLSWKKLSFFVLAFLILPATVAYAGFFTFIGDVFSKVSAERRPVNSQNIALLAAPAGPEAFRSDAPEVNTIGGSALLPSVGPSGGPTETGTSFDHGQISIYVVREGDSLSSIAEMFDVSVNTLLWSNNIARGAKIAIGQTLVILPVTGVQHTVKNGDTIESIAKKYHGDIEEIRSYNDIGVGDTLAIDAVIIIPDGEIPAAAQVATKPATSKLRGASGPSISGYFRAPMVGYRKTQGLHGYNGVDMSSYLGAPVYAAAEGTVLVSRSGGYNGGYGNYVVIGHPNGTQTLYGHLMVNHVKAGAHVEQGEVIGAEGNTGRSTGPHLHFEVRGARNPF